MSIPKQCPSCGGFCGGGKGKGCQYGKEDKDSTDKWIEAIIVVLRGELKSQAKAHKAELNQQKRELLDKVLAFIASSETSLSQDQVDLVEFIYTIKEQI